MELIGVSRGNGHIIEFKMFGSDTLPAGRRSTFLACAALGLLGIAGYGQTLSPTITGTKNAASGAAGSLVPRMTATLQGTNLTTSALQSCGSATSLPLSC